LTQPRPTAATAICIYEIIVGFCGLCYTALTQMAAYYTMAYRLHRPDLATHNSVVALSYAVASTLLSFGIAYFVWRLHPASFVLSLIKFLLGLFSTISVFYVLTTHGLWKTYTAYNPALIISFWVPRAIGFVLLLLSLAITIYLFRLTVTRKGSAPAGM
jgi:hypothetical protein